MCEEGIVLLTDREPNDQRSLEGLEFLIWQNSIRN
jgi:hypothetical protein